MKTIAERWSVFDEYLPGAGASAHERAVLRRAFYAGFGEALLALVEVSRACGANNDVGVTLLERLNDEMAHFAILMSIEDGFTA